MRYKVEFVRIKHLEGDSVDDIIKQLEAMEARGEIKGEEWDEMYIDKDEQEADIQLRTKDEVVSVDLLPDPDELH